MPRQFRVSEKLIAMLNDLPKTGTKVFGGTSLIAHRFNFTNQRNRLAKKLQNPRLKKISFHSFRHWKATMEYHRTKDILHVKEMLGHRRISSTMIYTHLVSFESNDYHVKTAKSLKEACALAKAGFSYFTAIQGVQVFRKPK
jgi:integrase